MAHTATDDMDVEMTPMAPSIQSMVNKAVAAALKKHAPQGQKRKCGQDSSSASGAKKKTTSDLMAQAKVSLRPGPSTAANALFLDVLQSRDLQVARHYASVHPAPLQTHVVPELTLL